MSSWWRSSLRAIGVGLAFGSLLLGGGNVVAQNQSGDPLQGRILQNSDGTLFVYKDGQRYLLQIAPVGDDLINAIPITGSADRVDQLFGSVLPPDAGATTNAVAPAPTPTPPPTATPRPAFAAVTDAWVDGGLRLIAGRPVRISNVAGDFLATQFRVENRTGTSLNFEVDKSVFYLQENTGKRYRALGINYPDSYGTYGNGGGGATSVIVNSLADGAGQDFQVTWDVVGATFEADKRNAAVTSYTEGVTEFTARIHDAKWQEDIQH